MERVGEQSGGTPSIWQSLLEIPSRDEYDGWRLRVFRALPLKATEDGASFKAENIARLQTRDFSTEVGAVGDGLAVGLLEGPENRESMDAHGLHASLQWVAVKSMIASAMQSKH